MWNVTKVEQWNRARKMNGMMKKKTKLRKNWDDAEIMKLSSFRANVPFYGVYLLFTWCFGGCCFHDALCVFLCV